MSLLNFLYSLQEEGTISSDVDDIAKNYCYILGQKRAEKGMHKELLAEILENKNEERRQKINTAFRFIRFILETHIMSKKIG
ncbi:hypothetical protein [Candidatus Coxiella mudrowiae]|uniref:hypothetical protein n=1 Tax=Candidatus Coxiella mudrowiae TaxID=2054173 RepID=UPI0012FEC5BB|nr:hypothetical protein [Candidatus Coxiella mudrowiae]